MLTVNRRIRPASFCYCSRQYPGVGTSAADIKYLDHLRRMFSPSCKAPERVDAVASASEGNKAGGKTDK